MNSGMLTIAIFSVCSVWIFFISRKPLRVAGSHGFYRVFAWEAMLALALINAPAWFSEPCTILHIISWISLTSSLLLLIPGAYLLLKKGKPTSQRQDDTLFSFEKTTVLVTDGMYRYIRHPLYGSLLFLAWGIFLKDVTWVTTGFTAAATLLLTATARADERECIVYFGSSYKEYIRRTKMFVPFIF
jgi:protein-S-isoprenylcysteine O-methyltransferase Ste14